jgi:hypothetical protein
MSEGKVEVEGKNLQSGGGTHTKAGNYYSAN